MNDLIVTRTYFTHFMDAHARYQCKQNPDKTWKVLVASDYIPTEDWYNVNGADLFDRIEKHITWWIEQLHETQPRLFRYDSYIPDKVSEVIPLCFKVTEEQKEAIRKANEETYKFYNMKNNEN